MLSYNKTLLQTSIRNINIPNHSVFQRLQLLLRLYETSPASEVNRNSMQLSREMFKTRFIPRFNPPFLNREISQTCQSHKVISLVRVVTWYFFHQATINFAGTVFCKTSSLTRISRAWNVCLLKDHILFFYWIFILINRVVVK